MVSLDDSAPTPRVIERGRRLSESVLWGLQRDLYNQRGIASWSHGNVPQTITTTPYIARAFARIVLGHVRDISDQLDPAQPIYIVELGAGSGRFAYRFIKQLSRLLQHSSLAHRSFKYIMTDVAPSLVEFWQSHSRLQPLAEEGILDFALFDATQRGDLRLTHSNVVLQEPTVNPVIVIANYFFDSIPHDYFSIRDHQLFENLVTVTSSRPDQSPIPELQVSDMHVSFEPNPVVPTYYQEAERNAVLGRYVRELDDVTLLLPVTAMACVRHFYELSGHRVLFLAGDIGSPRLDDVSARVSGGIGADSNFWLEVNFHALGEYVRELGGKVMHPPQRHAHINISAFALGGSTTGFVETALAFEENIAQNGPDDFFVLAARLVKSVDSMSRGELLAFLRSSGWDSDYFIDVLPHLVESLPQVSFAGKEDLRLAVEGGWEAFYPLGKGADPGDLSFGFGVLLYTIGDVAPALEYFLQSMEIVGPDPRTTFNIALCLWRLDRIAEAVTWLDRTLELDPNSAQAEELRASLLAR